MPQQYSSMCLWATVANLLWASWKNKHLIWKTSRFLWWIASCYLSEEANNAVKMRYNCPICVRKKCFSCLSTSLWDPWAETDIICKNAAQTENSGQWAVSHHASLFPYSITSIIHPCSAHSTFSVTAFSWGTLWLISTTNIIIAFPSQSAFQGIPAIEEWAKEK